MEDLYYGDDSLFTVGLASMRAGYGTARIVNEADSPGIFSFHRYHEKTNPLVKTLQSADAEVIGQLGHVSRWSSGSIDARPSLQDRSA